MSTLGSKSGQQISDLLDEYGIKHGPIVDSTRSLYENKLREAMSKATSRTSRPSDKTYYREEEEEVTYVYRTPVRSDGPGDNRSYMRSRPEWTERGFKQEPLPPYDTPSTSRNTYLKATPMKPPADAPKAPKSSPFVPLWLKFVVFLAVALFLYFVFYSMESNEYTKKIE